MDFYFHESILLGNRKRKHPTLLLCKKGHLHDIYSCNIFVSSGNPSYLNINHLSPHSQQEGKSHHNIKNIPTAYNPNNTAIYLSLSIELYSLQVSGRFYTACTKTTALDIKLQLLSKIQNFIKPVKVMIKTARIPSKIDLFMYDTKSTGNESENGQVE